MKTKEVAIELKNHIPFTALATLIATIFAIIFYKTNLPEDLFEIFHPLHILASAIVTSAIFYKYKPKIIPAILIGVSGAIIIGSLSDIIFPYLGGIIFNLNTRFHLPILEKPILILSTAIFGSILGAKIQITKFPHFIHVSLSIFASLFYLLAFSKTLTPINFIESFLVVFLAVLIPCCISDIIYPLLFINKRN